MGKKEQDELLKTLGDFTSKENWDSFFTIRGTSNAFEWYAEWPQLKTPLLSHLSATTPQSPVELQILVPGCGNSRLSENLYDEGYKNITNIDFSKVVISEMLRRNIRSRPEMKWRVMDMTNMQLEIETFDTIVDKGGLDALMEPKLGPKLGNPYLSEVKRVLKAGGKFICLTLGEPHVLALLFPKFRFGWKVSIHSIPKKGSERSNLQTFMVVSEKDDSALMWPISSFINLSVIDRSTIQAKGLVKIIENENEIRSKYSSESDIVYLLEELKIGAKGNLSEFSPGRRVHLTLGELGVSRFIYKSVLLDAREDSGPFLYDCGAFLVPKSRANEWLFSSEEGQWLVVESSKAARLVMILLDSSHNSASMDEIQADLSPMVKQLAPQSSNGVQIPFLAASDGIKQRKIIHQVTSDLTGPIIVDDVIYEEVDDNISSLFPSKDIIFRRLTFERSEALVQSEAVLTNKQPVKFIGEKEKNKGKSKKKGNQRKSTSNGSGSGGDIEEEKLLKVDHNYLASSYHTGIISGFVLISHFLENMSANQGTIKASVIGLGAGLLPMFLHKCMPFLDLTVLELDPMVLDLAKDYFEFLEDEHLKVHITDGIKYVKEIASFEDESKKNDILIIDVDSSESSSGLSCPAPNFVEESFLLDVKNSLSEQGLFVINLVTRSQAIKDMVFSRMKLVFSHLFHLKLEEDVNEIIFATKAESCIKEEDFPKACEELGRLLKLEKMGLSEKIIDTANKIKRLT